MRIVSLNTQVKQVCGLADSDLTDWEAGFVATLSEKTSDGRDVSGLSERQIEAVEGIYQKHFA
jgi:hypothetical protein